MVSRYELGVSQTSIQQLEKIARIIGVPVSTFFEGNTKNTTPSNYFKNAFVFDLDETLIDGRQFCGETVARVVTSINPSIDFDTVVKFHDSIRGNAMEDMYSQAIKTFNLKSNVFNLLKLDRRIQEDNIDKMKLFDGVVEILEFLKNNHKKLYICTNRTKGLMMTIFETNHILPYFDEVISCIDAGFKKPNPYCLVDLIQRSGIPAGEFIYFGDSEVDSQFAQNANIDHIIFDQYLNNKNLFKKLVNMFLEKQINGER